MSLDLKHDLKRGIDETQGVKPCPVCEMIANAKDGETKELLTAAAAGSMGINKLAGILSRHEMGVGVRSIRRHREEGHLK